MGQEILNLGSSPNDGNGDTIRVGGGKINDNFTELYGLVVGTNIIPVDSTLSAISQYLSGGVYTIPKDVALSFTDKVYNFGTNSINLSHTDGCYFLRSTCFPLITYTGTGAFITNSAQGTLLNIEKIFLSTPNGNGFTLTGNSGVGNSLITKLFILLDQENPSTIDDFAFLTNEFPIVIASNDGIVATNVDIINISNPQFNDNLDVSGTFLTVAGTGTLLKISMVDSRPESSEAFLDIQAGYAGSVSIAIGVHVIGGGDFFKSGSRDQNDNEIIVIAIKNTPSSSAIAGIHIAPGDEAATTIVDTEETIIAGAYTEDIANRFTTTAAGRITYTGIADLGVSLMMKCLATPAAGNDRDYDFYIRHTKFIGTVETLIPITFDTINVDSGTPQKAVLIGSILLSTSDFLDPIVIGQGNDINVTCTGLAFTVTQ